MQNLVQNSLVIGSKIEYTAGGELVTGLVVDKFTALSQREGRETKQDYYLVQAEGGRVFKISPMQVKRILK